MSWLCFVLEEKLNVVRCIVPAAAIIVPRGSLDLDRIHLDGVGRRLTIELLDQVLVVLKVLHSRILAAALSNSGFLICVLTKQMHIFYKYKSSPRL
jgi:hypothetical protein